MTPVMLYQKTRKKKTKTSSSKVGIGDVGGEQHGAVSNFAVPPNF